MRPSSQSAQPRALTLNDMIEDRPPQPTNKPQPNPPQPTNKPPAHVPPSSNTNPTKPSNAAPPATRPLSSSSTIRPPPAASRQTKLLPLDELLPDVRVPKRAEPKPATAKVNPNKRPAEEDAPDLPAPKRQKVDQKAKVCIPPLSVYAWRLNLTQITKELPRGITPVPFAPTPTPVSNPRTPSPSPHPLASGVAKKPPVKTNLLDDLLADIKPKK